MVLGYHTSRESLAALHEGHGRQTTGSPDQYHREQPTRRESPVEWHGVDICGLPELIRAADLFQAVPEPYNPGLTLKGSDYYRFTADHTKNKGAAMTTSDEEDSH